MDSTILTLFLLIGCTLAVVGGMFAVSHLLGPKAPSEVKMAPFESGNVSDGADGQHFYAKFYLAAILLVVFDVESVVLYLWATVLRTAGWVALVSMTSFIAMLALGLLYAIRKGALEWNR